MTSGLKKFLRASICVLAMMGVSVLASKAYANPMAKELTRLLDSAPQREDVSLDTASQQLIHQGIQAYLNLVLQNKQVEISQSTVELVEQVKTFIDAEITAGRLSQESAFLINSRLAQAHEALTAYQGALRKGQTHYFKLFQRVPSKETMYDPLAPSEVVPESLVEALRLARKHDATLADFQPKHLQDEEQVRNAYAFIETKRQSLHTWQEAETIAQEAFNAHQDKMQSGEENIIDVLDGALDLLDARIARTASDYAYRYANYKLLLATGQLDQNSMSQLITETTLQPVMASNDHLIQDLLDGEAKNAYTTAPNDFIELGAGVVTYNDMAAFEAAHGAPFSQELAPEVGPGGQIELHDPNGYYLVLGSFSEPAYAQKLMTMAAMDNAFLKPVAVNGATYQRVLVGPLSQNEVETFKMAAQERGISDSWVLKK
ncbi:MAG: TolC family protein [Methylocystaceae bacterium]|nr:TolC family protein [Methylocystaceae bacterium]